MDILSQVIESLQRGDASQVAALTQQVLEARIPPKTILNDGLIAGMAAVGERFRKREIFLPDVLLAARAMYAGLDLLKPLLAAGNMPSRGKVVLGTVSGDLHDIGKNLVGIMLKGAGYEVIDLGNDVSPARFVDTAIAEGATIIGMSALLTTTMPVMAEVATLLRERELKNAIKLIIGGAPVTAEYATRIGADAYGYDAVKAVEIVNRLVPEQ